MVEMERNRERKVAITGFQGGLCCQRRCIAYTYEWGFGMDYK